MKHFVAFTLYTHFRDALRISGILILSFKKLSFSSASGLNRLILKLANMFFPPLKQFFIFYLLNGHFWVTQMHPENTSAAFRPSCKLLERLTALDREISNWQAPLPNFSYTPVAELHVAYYEVYEKVEIKFKTKNDHQILSKRSISRATNSYQSTLVGGRCYQHHIRRIFRCKFQCAVCRSYRLANRNRAFKFDGFGKTIVIQRPENVALMRSGSVLQDRTTTSDSVIKHARAALQLFS